jgi:predicted NUDIX family NTP pyrophosphohydrolase
VTAVVTRSKKQSAGVLVYRRKERVIQVLLAHPGGPIFRHRDALSWTIPKGEIEPGELPLDAARRELREETGFELPGPYVSLGSVKLKSGKIVHAWACEGDVDLSAFKSCLFEMEWPPRSGRRGSFPELDRVEYFDVEVARLKLNEAQAELVSRLLAHLALGA